jgi:hypothetical protein
MQVNGQRDLLGYRDFLRATPDEASALLADMLIGVTQFFRDREAFDFLERDVIASLFAAEPGDGQVRVWIAGCATGEEAYSVALLLARAREAAMSSQSIQFSPPTSTKRRSCGRARVLTAFHCRRRASPAAATLLHSGGSALRDRQGGARTHSVRRA